MPSALMPLNLVTTNTIETGGLSWSDAKLNVAFGSLMSTANSTSNIAIGSGALVALPNGSAGLNVAVGTEALNAANTATTRNTAVGYRALKANVNADNVGIGHNAGLVATGAGGTYVGAHAGESATTATFGTYVGSGAGFNNVTGASNTLIGNACGQSLTSANNTMVGYQAGSSISTGGTNTIVGTSAGANLITGTGNTFVGYSASAGASAVTDATIVGRGAGCGANNAISIGKGCQTGFGVGAVAIGCDSGGTSATTAVNNEFKFGTVNHTYNFPGKVSVMSIQDATNLVLGTGTGTSLGSASNQKLGFWGAAPVVRNTGWTVTAGYTPDRTLNAASTTLNELAAVVGTLIDQLKTYGLLG